MAEVATGQNNPIQVFLDTEQFLQVQRRPGGGGNKDFYDGDNEGFSSHKAKVRQFLEDASSEMEVHNQKVGFLVVQMRQDALAKSYRPLHALFTPGNSFALVGGGKPGEMYIQGSRWSLAKLSKLIEEKAEIVPREVYNDKTEQIERRVSAYRSEVGAIISMRLPNPSDRIQFSARDAIDWLDQGSTLGGYSVEFFRPDGTLNPDEFRERSQQLLDKLMRFGGLEFRPHSTLNRHHLACSAMLFRNLPEPRVALPLGVRNTQESSQFPILDRDELADLEPDFNIERHQALLDILGNEPLIRSVELPPVVQANPLDQPTQVQQIVPPAAKPERSYPVVGILDGGVSAKANIESWRTGSADIIDQDDRDEYHGTFIAGLLAAVDPLNPHLSGNVEPSGCQFFDLDIMPREGLLNSYYATQAEFFDQLETLVEQAKNKSGVRVFNISLGMPKARGRNSYSTFADILDQIALRYDVIFVVSAGNLKENQRPPWPDDGEEAVKMLAELGSSDDHITSPAEHLLGLTVGAVNPPGVANQVELLPTTYTRRGPGAGHARKPDLSHFGGAKDVHTNHTGLYSLNENGLCVSDKGTSFAAPLVASTIAHIDHALDQTAARETLLGLVAHRAERSRNLVGRPLKHIARDFVGFGSCPPAEVCMQDGPNAVTLLFSERLLEKRELDFVFTWPKSMVTETGKCRGNADITLAYTPPIDKQFDAECLRARLEAYLYQLEVDDDTGEISENSRLKLEDSGLPQNLEYTEKYLIENGLKWTPLKRYHLAMPRGRGKSSDWKLSLKGYLRAGALFPTEGIPFALIMTVYDPDNSAQVFDEMRNEILRRGLNLSDINVAHKIRT